MISINSHHYSRKRKHKRLFIYKGLYSIEQQQVSTMDGNDSLSNCMSVIIIL